MGLVLRPYQDAIISRARELFQSGARSLIIQAPTGSGKTALTARILHLAAQNSWFIVHRRELLNQAAAAFNKEGLNYVRQRPGSTEVFLTTIGKLSRSYKTYAAPKLIVWDEAHHIAAQAWSKIYREFPGAYHIGLTATPERLDGRGLSAFFQAIIKGPEVSELINEGYLSTFKIYAPGGINTAGIPKRAGDFAADALARAVNKPHITGNAVEHYRRLCYGKRAIVFCVSREHSRDTVVAFNATGIAASHIDGETPSSERDAAIKSFAEGSTKVLSNVEIFGEGFDLPQIECAILLRPTLSLPLYLQQIGRALRPFEGKTQAIILDHVGNVERHGFPDEPRNWTLEGYTSKRSVGSISVRICSKCFAAQRPGAGCQFCGADFPLTPREIAEKEGELQEAIRKEAKRQVGRARTYQELLAIEKERGYKHGWAYNVLRGRGR